MRVEPLYTARFLYSKARVVGLNGNNGREEERYLIAEGTCEGRISGKFEGVNHPRKRTDETFLLNMQGFIETEDKALLMFDYQGYGRTIERSQASDVLEASGKMINDRVQILGFARHLTENEKYRRLNDTVCAIAGEARFPQGIPVSQVKPTELKLVFDIAELVWEPPG